MENILIKNGIIDDPLQELKKNRVVYYKNSEVFVSKVKTFNFNKDVQEIKTPKSRPPFVFFPKDRPAYQVKKNSYILKQKRIVDVVISLIAILTVLSWLYPLLFMLIKVESKGPVLFRQKRTGLNGISFDCLKFRSMLLTEQDDELPTSNYKERVTTIGRFIRKFSLDELPQFFNVFKGDMSIVGPRPHMVHETELFIEQLTDFDIRHQVKPGITGLAQVSGYRGFVNGISHLKNRLRYDLYYIETASLNQDLKIILKTISCLFVGDKQAK